MRRALAHPSIAAASLATATGVFAWLAFPSVGWWPLAFVAFAPLSIALRGARPLRAFLLGALSGTLMTALGFSFLYDAIRTHGGLPPALALVALALLHAYHGLRLGLACAIAARVGSRGVAPELALLVTIPAAEALLPAPIPWTFGASLMPALPLVQTADIFGAAGPTAVALAPGLALAWALRMRIARPLRARTIALRSFAWGVLGPMAALAYGLVRISSIEASAGSDLVVGLVQPALGAKERNLGAPLLIEMTRELHERGAGLVVWSEAAYPGPYPEADLDAFSAIVQGDVSVPTIVGVTIRADPPQRGTYNAALLVEPARGISARYDKRSLLPFAERLPLEASLPLVRTLSPRSGHFVEGDRRAPLVTEAGHALAVTICYEDILAADVRDLVRDSSADLLVNLTNDAWFDGTSAPAVHFELSRLRAIEHRRALVRAANTGVTAMVHPTGAVIARAPEHERTTLLAGVPLGRGTTIYAAIGDIPLWAFAIGLVGLSLSAERAPRRRTVRSSAPS
jgi:apolipoprotein N-acyltransferase